MVAGELPATEQLGTPAIIVVMGVYPQPFLRRMEPAVQKYVARIQQKIAAAPTAEPVRLAADPHVQQVTP